MGILKMFWFPFCHKKIMVYFKEINHPYPDDRKFVVSLIKDIRGKMRNQAQKSKVKVRSFRVQELYIEATSHYNLAVTPLEDASIEPPITIGMSKKQLN